MIRLLIISRSLHVIGSKFNRKELGFNICVLRYFFNHNFFFSLSLSLSLSLKRNLSLIRNYNKSRIALGLTIFNYGKTQSG